MIFSEVSVVVFRLAAFSGSSSSGRRHEHNHLRCSVCSSLDGDLATPHFSVIDTT